MNMIFPTMFRDMQNPDTPNLPFAQPLLPTMFRDMQNPDTPNLPFSQSDNRAKLCYNVTSSTGLTSKQVLTQPQVNYFQNVMGYKVVKCSDDPNTPTGSSGYSKSQIEKIIEEYHGDDISLLHSHAVNFGNKLKETKQERDRIEAKVEANKTEHSVLWDSITEKADKSHSHGGGGSGNGCEWYDIPCHFGNFTGQVGTVVLVAGVGYVAYKLLKKRTRR